MRIIDADKFLAYLIYSKHIDSLTCGEVKEAIKMCEVDVLDEQESTSKMTNFRFCPKCGKRMAESEVRNETDKP